MGEGEDGFGEVEIFDDEDGGGRGEEEGVGGGVGGFGGASDGVVVDSDHFDLMIDEPAGTVFGEEGGMVVPFGGSGAFVSPAGGEEDDAVGEIWGEFLGEEFGGDGRARGDAAEVGDEGRTGEGVEGELIDGFSASDFVEWGVKVAAGVADHGDVFHVPTVEAVVGVGRDDFGDDGGMDGAVGAGVVHGLGEVDELHGGLPRGWLNS